MRLLDGAVLDAEHATEWYRAEAGDEVAARFALAVDEALVRIADWPLIGREHEPGVRFVVVRGFPFVVFYRVIEEGLDVLAVAHGRREPGFWRER